MKRMTDERFKSVSRLVNSGYILSPTGQDELLQALKAERAVVDAAEKLPDKWREHEMITSSIPGLEGIMDVTMPPLALIGRKYCADELEQALT